MNDNDLALFFEQYGWKSYDRDRYAEKELISNVFLRATFDLDLYITSNGESFLLNQDYTNPVDFIQDATSLSDLKILGGHK